MMTTRCLTHGTLVRDLARGRLDAADAERAELLLVECPACAEAWEAAVGGPAAGLVDEVVADVFAAVELPRRRGLRPIWAVAAAAVLALGVSFLWQPAGQQAPTVAQSPSAGANLAISTMDFEGGAAEQASRKGHELINAIDFERGMPAPGSPRT